LQEDSPVQFAKHRRIGDQGETFPRIMPFLAEPLYVATVLCLLVGLAEWLSRRKFFRYLGSPLIVILGAAVLANVGLLPSSRNARTYAGFVIAELLK
jgi:uncharacterized membrane protein